MSENLKVIATADAGGVKKGMQEAKQSIKDFEGVSKNALSQVASMFGVDTQEVEKLASAAQGLGAKLERSGNAGAKALGAIVSSAGAASVAIAAIGVGAVVTSFKALNAQAAAFKNTVQGANIELETTAWIETYRQAMRDTESDVGKTVAEAESKWKQFWARFGQMGETTIVETFKNMFGGTGRMPGIAGGGIISGMGAASQADQQSIQRAETAKQLAGDLYDIRIKELDLLPEIEKHNAAIATAQATIRNTAASVADRTAALNTATEEIRKKYAEQLALKEQELADFTKINDQAGTSVQDYEKQKQLEAEVERLKAQQAQEQAALVRYANSVNSAAEKEAKAQGQTTSELQKQLDLASQIIDKSIDRSMSLPDITPDADAASALQTAMKNAEHLEIPAKLKFDTKETQTSVTDLTDQVKSLMEEGLMSAGESLGTLIGNLATGGDAWGSFANTAISAMGDMAIAVGKIAISTGVASLAIKASLDSLNGYAAIAAGVALVALGTAVKSGLSNIASGDYSSSSSVATAQSSYQRAEGNDYREREINLQVTGVLRADGSQLVAVIGNTGRERRNTV